jgi:hypothetical protein
MAGVHVVGDLPDRVERIPLFGDGGRSPKNKVARRRGQGENDLVR